MTAEHRHFIPIWFFIGCLLLIYGILILGASIFEPQPPTVVLTSLHAGIWWGGLLTVIGVVYCLKFRPK
jgi:hypothetical protein